MAQLEYIGEQQIYKDVLTNVSIELVPHKVYDLQLKYDGPINIINGALGIDPEQTFWLIFNQGQISIPYSPEAALNYWRMPQ